MTAPRQDREANLALSTVAEHPRPTQVRQAAGIYGLIVTAAVFATAGGHLRTLPLAISVVVTLLVYWLAEEYAEVGARTSAGHRPTWAIVRSALAAKWPMVTASYLPLLCLLAARLLGASPVAAAYTGLGATVALLTYYGWSAGRASSMRGLGLLLMTSIAAAMGILMILLKILIAHVH